ncbi:hypothetical protein GCM10009570_25450 [Dietzia natronolimnaea]
MERELHNQPSPLEYEDSQLREGLGRVATYLAFEQLMQAADDGECTRDQAIGCFRALRPFIGESAAERTETAS